MKIKKLQNLIDKLRGKNSNNLGILVRPHIPPKSTFKHLITITGFGHSGSGVLADLLSEFDNTTVYAHHDKNGFSPLSLKKGHSVEVDFLRRYGGVFDLEHAFQPNNINSFMYLLNFINLQEYYYQTSDASVYDDRFMQLTYKFIDNLIACKFEVDNPLAGNPAFRFRKAQIKDYQNILNPFVLNKNKKYYSFILKELSVPEYRKLAAEYIKDVFSGIESKDFCVLDQLLSDKTADFDRYKDFIGEFKNIAVCRDPRDVFVTGILLGENWIPHKKEAFVVWYQRSGIEKYLKAKSPLSLTVRFEDLVLNYSNSIPKIINFLGLNKENHISPQTQFRPEYSSRNIGLYKNFNDQESIKFIEKKLEKYCYYPEKENLSEVSNLLEGNKHD